MELSMRGGEANNGGRGASVTLYSPIITQQTYIDYTIKFTQLSKSFGSGEVYETKTVRLNINPPVETVSYAPSGLLAASSKVIAKQKSNFVEGLMVYVQSLFGR
jgi:hypothetical protein